MAFASNWLALFGRPAGFVADALLLSVAGILAPIAFILARRAWRQRYFRRRAERTFQVRQKWEYILRGAIPPEKWRFDRLDCDIIESIVLDRLDAAPPEETVRLTDFLRRSGLLDMRIWEARRLRGWARQAALISLGRMRAPEGIPALAEALDEDDPDIRVAALRGLGRTGLPAAGEAILKRIAGGGLRLPATPLQNALLMSCRHDPNLALRYVRRAEDSVRPLLARVLAEIATPELDEELLLLASDPLPEVRAQAARAMAQAKPKLALTALATLAGDEAWFVRLRAVVAMGELNDPRSIPLLIGTLCDPNRHVRLRSASALARLEEHLGEILQAAVESRDRYALQSFVSELERSGRMIRLIEDLQRPGCRRTAEAALVTVVRCGAHRMLLDALVHHPAWRTRTAVARLLAGSGEQRLVAPLEALRGTAPTARARRVIDWILLHLREQTSPASRKDRVPA
jgi:HEAT repeat protein